MLQLEYSFIDKFDCYLFRVCKQDTRDFEPFFATNGLEIRAGQYPSWYSKLSILNVRGVQIARDWEAAVVTNAIDMERIRDAVMEFNTTRNGMKREQDSPTYPDMFSIM